ncbi:putative Mitochondrial processing peptidase [Candidatus Zixiibacteriota bacterium]|nr:putative Mitochondrial processing peptidase [candidate division Zixibacteria bacterium]
MKAKTIISIMTLFLLAFAGVLQAQKIELGPDGYGRGQLTNGITVLYNVDKSTSLTGGRILIAGGVMTETPADNGISNLMINMLLKGNDRMTASQITERLDFLGAQVATEDFRDYSAITFVCLSRNLPEVMDILGRCVTAPTFPDDELAKLKVQVAGDIKSDNDNQTTASSILFWKTLYGDNGYGLPVRGTESSIADITADMIRNYYKKYMGGNNIIIALATDLSPDETLPLLNNFASLPARAEAISAPQLTRQTAKEGFVSYDRNQSFIFMGYPLPHLDAHDVLLLAMINDAMGANVGSRLWALRQVEKLAYTVFSQYGLDRYDGIFRAAIGTDTSKVKTALASLNREFRKLYDGGISEDELTDSKVNIKNSLIYRIEAKENRAGQMAVNEYIGYGYKFVYDMMKGIPGVTVAEMNQFIKSHLNPDDLYLAIVGKK